MRRFLRDTGTGAKIGIVLAIVLLGIAILGPALLPGDPNAIDVRARFAGPSWQTFNLTSEGQHTKHNSLFCLCT